MAYRMNKREASSDAIKRLCREQLEGAIADASGRDLPGDEVVHEVRKRTKKVRALLRLVCDELGNAYKQENAAIRDAARLLSHIRDATSVIEAYDRLMDRFENEVNREEFAGVRSFLAGRRKVVAGEDADLERQLTDFALSMRAVLERVDRWPLSGAEFDLFRRGFVETYGQGVKAMRAAVRDDSAESFHEWRKQAKGHWYHLRVLEPIWTPVIRERIAQTDALSDLLGHEHDLTVLRAVIQGELDPSGLNAMLDALDVLIDTHRRDLRAGARLLGLRVFADRPEALGRLFNRYWKAWRLEEGTAPDL